MPIDNVNSFQYISQLSNQSAYHQAASVANIRDKALEETALEMGAQSALAHESIEINKLLNENKSALDRVFNFNQLLLDYHVLPPVIELSKNSINLSQDSQVIRISGKTYKIISQVRFVTAAPTWRDYLYMTYKNPEKQNSLLYPKNKEEKKIWIQYLAKGWEQGIEQAKQIFILNVNRLVRDFKGMILYKELLEQNLVSLPYIKTQYQGVTGNKNKLMIDDENYAIQLKPELLKSTKLWHPVIENSDEENLTTSRVQT